MTLFYSSGNGKEEKGGKEHDRASVIRLFEQQENDRSCEQEKEGEGLTGKIFSFFLRQQSASVENKGAFGKFRYLYKAETKDSRSNVIDIV